MSHRLRYGAGVNAPRLSKSRFVSGQQCHLRLWYEVHARELATPPDAATEAVFALGHEVGRLARERFPGGVLVEEDHRQGSQAVRTTRTLLAASSVPALYEGGFEHAGVRVRADIVVRSPDGGWDLVEVKSSTRVKQVHDLDLAIQAWVLRGAGVALRRVGVLTLDRDYVWPGGDYDLDALFRLHDRTETVEAMLPDIGHQVEQLHAMLAAAHAPRVAPGRHCHTPYACSFHAHCTRDIVTPQWPLDSLPGLHAHRREVLEAMGIEDVREIPEDFALGALQQVAREAVRTGAEVIHGDLGAALAGVRAPVHHLDFETLASAIPRYPGTRAYDAVAFQFSVHTRHADGTLAHVEYLHPDDSDPREPLARALLAALGEQGTGEQGTGEQGTGEQGTGEQGTIVVYTGFERRVIEALAGALPALAAPLRALLPRLWDLYVAVRANYYHPQFRGSYSIKSVLPALVPELSYEGLAIADGNLAAASYLQALGSADRAQRAQIFAALREYCARDTFALVRIRELLAMRVRALAQGQH